MREILVKELDEMDLSVEGIGGDLTYEAFINLREVVTMHCFKLFTPQRELMTENRIKYFKLSAWP